MTYTIYLHPQPYGYKIKAKSAKQALKIAQRRWEKSCGSDFDFDATYADTIAWEVISKTK